MSFRNYSFDSSSYGRNTARGSTSSTERPTSVTAKYLNTTPSFKTSSIPIPSTERARDETPISAIASRYASYSTKTEKEKPPPPTPTTSKYERKDYKLSVPPATITRSRDVSPVSTKYGLTRPSRHLSPERKTKSYKDLKSRDPSPSDRDKDIPSKTDKSSGYNSLSSYKLYPRPTPTYSRPSSRAETKPESSYNRPSSRTEIKPDSLYTRPSSRTETKPESTYTRPSSRTEIKSDTSYTRPPSRTDIKSDVTVNRYGISNRLSNNYLRSPPTVKRTSVSPINHPENPKTEPEKKSVSPCTVIKEESPKKEVVENNKEILGNGVNNAEKEEDCEMETVTVITRHTSPTPPGSSVYVRTRRADMAKTIEKTRTRKKKRPEMVDREIQSDRLDDPTRSSRFGSTARASTLTNWSLYTPSATSYTGYAGRYSTQPSTLRDNAPNNSYNDRSSRSVSTEPHPRDIESSSPSIEKKLTSPPNVIESNQDITLYGQNKDDETSEIIINVNLKLTRAKSPLAVASAELVSPEITITNSQLPPQVPKNESSTKPKKLKVRKTSSDSSTDSSTKKKIIKRKSKSGSSSDSDQNSETVDKSKDNKPVSPPKSIQKTSSSNNLSNGHMKSKHSKSRESNSPESSITLSTQSSLSEEDMTSKSKTNEVSRTSADEISIPTDRSAKQQSPVSHKNEGATEEAKSFLIRALAPVTSLFKRHQESSDSRWLETSTSESTGKDVSNITTESDRSKSKNNTDNIVTSNDNNQVKLKAIRHIESGERAWWMDSDSEKKNTNTSENQNSPAEKNIPKKIRHIESGERAWWLESNGESKTEKLPPTNGSDNSDNFKIPKKNKYVEDEKPWWLDSCANIPEGIERLTPPRKSSSDSEKSEKYNFFKVRHIESGEQKDWWATSNENSSNSKPEHANNLSKSNSNQNSLSKSGSYQNSLSKSGSCQNSLSKSGSNQPSFPRRIRHIESGERPWWLASDKNIPEGIEKLPTPPPQEDSDSSDSDEVQVYIPSAQIPPFPLHLDDEPLGDRRSPEGLETPKETEQYEGRMSPYENHRQFRRRGSGTSYQKSADKFVSRYTDIDDILGTSGQIYRPFMDSILARRTGQMPYDDEVCEEIDPTQVRIHDSTAQRPVIKKLRSRSEIIDCRDEDQLDDATLQVFKDGDYGPYLDLDSTLNEQDEELEGLQESRKNAIILRTQLSVRVHAIIERLLHSQGRELRRALFTLKQILQSDKDLVHEFVANKGLDCLMQVSSMADHNYLDYILRALGQILLYVDGMHGVMANKHCIQWLYSLISSKFRHVVKTALKLLLVFVEYTEKNCLLLIDAINTVDTSKGRQPWYNVMKILQDFDASDTELLIYATTLINRCLNSVPDRDMYYDQVDALQDQGMDNIVQLYMSKQGTDLDLLRQLQIFEAVLLYEDGDESGTALKQLDESVINSVHRRSLNLNTSDRRKSKKQQMKDKAKQATHAEPEPSIREPKTLNNIRPPFLPSILDNKENKELNTVLKRRRDRFTRQAHHITQQREMLNSNGFSGVNGNLTNGSYFYGDYSNGNYCNGNGKPFSNGVNGHQEEEERPHINNLCDKLINGNQRYTAGLKQRIQNGTLGHSVTPADALTVIRQKMELPVDSMDDRGVLLNREHSIKDLAQRLTSPVSPTTEEKPLRVSDMAGIVSKAKEELAKSQSKEVIKSPTIEKSPKLHEIKISENDLHWEELKKGCLNREFHLCDLDFSDLRQDTDDEMSSPATNAAGIPPPPPPGMFPLVGVPPPPPGSFPPFAKNVPAPPPKHSLSEISNDSDSSIIKKNKKTVKLFWREIQECPPPTVRTKIGGFIWDDLPDVKLDTAMLEHLFESRTNDLIIKKLMEPKRNLILDAKRSNAINIAMKKLPTPQTIKAAIMKMDATVIGREGIEKLLTMLPTEEEKVKIQEAQYANPDLPLGSAEQFLLTLASINELSSRLKLWVFKLDFDNLEKEVAEPLMDLKQGIEQLKINKTFKVILSTLRSVGSFLNGSQVRGFRLEYLSKVMEVKDTVHKHPLLYHICEMIIEKFPDSTDFFSEVGPVIRASKVDFDILAANLSKLESDCKASWDHMKRVAKHDSSQIFKTKINEFLTDAAERIILLTIIKKRVMSRYTKFLLFLGVPAADISKTKPSEFLKVIAEFALEYRTSRERVLQQLEKKANHRERNKTRGKMIIDVANYSAKNGDHTADNALKELLKTDPDTDSLTDGRRKMQVNSRRNLVNGDLSADDEIIESLVRSATTKRRPVTRERRKNRLSDKKNLNRTLDGH
ncbi:uncharacterized protein LOC133524847 isoform X1 [Cydia pomonella]|uniref:uncharacterized protein LOC133524847 isoform X1 n=1 Tax=Cydia pomonella TaxID=82600 RepID=UPI002ADE861D|nr:uncharacterized protein LOC133524847 isoform X1 [Cydia pomonella]XP_061717077.1 uncharacterized protein LOC133524847 isoform X1 [Cydia pomonella]